jgi:hypothetical protein
LDSKSSLIYKPFRERKLLKIFGIISVFVLLLIFLAHLSFSRFPAKNKKINANILMVEGFLPEPALEKVKDEFQHSGYEKLVILVLIFQAITLRLQSTGT